MAHKGDMKVKDASIRRLDDGTLIYSVHMHGEKDKNGMMSMGEHYEYAFDDPAELAEAISADFGLKKAGKKKEEPDLSSMMKDHG